MPKMIKVALFASGGGSTVAAILDAVRAKRLSVDPVVLIVSRNDAGVIEKARERGFDENQIEIIRPRDFQTPEHLGDAIIRACTMRDVEVIGQYGWLPKTPTNVIEAFPQIVNQHPGALDPDHATKERPNPDFGGKGMYGRRVIAAALHFAKRTGTNWWIEATTHLVENELDTGKLVRYEQVPIFETDTVDSIQSRLLPIEHRVQIAALADIAREEKILTTRRFEQFIMPSQYEELCLAKAQAIADYARG